MSLGFRVMPTPESGPLILTDTEANDADRFLTGATPAHVPRIDGQNVCVWAGNNCSGGPVHDGLSAGFGDAFALTLTGAFGSELDITNIGIKFQGCRECGPEAFVDVSGLESLGSGDAIVAPTAVSGTSPLLLLVGPAILGRFVQRRFIGWRQPSWRRRAGSASARAA